MNIVEGSKEMEGTITNTNGECYKIKIDDEIPFTDIGFKPGDIVRLKSGSPDMVVEKAKEHKVHCAWYTDGKMRKIVMRNDTVEYAREEVPAPEYNPYRQLLAELYTWMKKEIVEWEWDNRKFSPPVGEITSGRIKGMREVIEKIDLFYEKEDLADKE